MSDNFWISLFIAIPATIGAIGSVAALVLTAIGNRRLAATRIDLAIEAEHIKKTTRDMGWKVATAVSDTNGETQRQIDRFANGGPDGLEARVALRMLATAEEAARRVLAEARQDAESLLGKAATHALTMIDSRCGKCGNFITQKETGIQTRPNP